LTLRINLIILLILSEQFETKMSDSEGESNFMETMLEEAELKFTNKNNRVNINQFRESTE
jgi:hypothetical protein